MPSSSQPVMSKVAVLVPAWQPGAALHALAAELRALGLARIVVVDDGSSGESLEVLRAVAEDGVTVLRHERNLGKGCALKTGFRFVLERCDGVAGVVTADCDGQHRAEDVLRVAQALVADPGNVVLGERSLGREAPWRSRVGNAAARRLFHALTGTRLIDTQTGLRGITTGLLHSLLHVQGERYEYELAMLLWLCRNGVGITAVPVSTLYLDGNRASHFRPLRDSARVYGVLLRESRR
jgi:glycosyltransferase involved in cell wall biosynthesis